jgi:hypothetical protein
MPTDISPVVEVVELVEEEAEAETGGFLLAVVAVMVLFLKTGCLVGVVGKDLSL